MKLYSIIGFDIDADSQRENVRDGFFDNFSLTPTLYPTLTLAQQAALAAMNEEIDSYNEGNEESDDAAPHVTDIKRYKFDEAGKALEHPYWDVVDDEYTMQVFRICEMDFSIDQATCIDKRGPGAALDFHVRGISSDGQWIELKHKH